MPDTYIKYKNSRIHHIRFGHGDKILLAFHGFSENGNSFLSLEPSLGEKYTVFAFDLPYHGETIWSEHEPFSKNDLFAFVQQFLSERSIKRFSVLGFSMGGKCALYITGQFAAAIDELFLMASDGIKTNKIYNVAVYPKWGRELFKTTIRHPTWIFIVIKTAAFLHLLSPWLKKFTQVHMETKEKRQRLYDTWMSMSDFNPDIVWVKENINRNHIRSYLFFGKRDEVIPVSVGEWFADSLQNCHFFVLDRGHYFVDERLNPILAEALETV